MFFFIDKNIVRQLFFLILEQISVGLEHMVVCPLYCWRAELLHRSWEHILISDENAERNIEKC